MPQKLVGAPVKRKGAVRNLTGHETFLDDISFSGVLCCRFVRSTYAHARIIKVDVAKALKVPGVAAVITSKETARLCAPLKVDIFPGNPNIKPLHYQYLAAEKTRFAGEPIAAIIAENGYAAADAADVIEVEYEPLPVVSNVEDAMKTGSPLLYDEWGDNLMYKIDFRCGDVEGAFKAADKVIGETFRSHRYMPCPMEGRGVAARYNSADGSLEFWASTQHVHIERLLLARALRMDEQRIRVSAPSVGGGFGMKLGFFSESVVVAIASMITGKPVKWVEDRQEHFLASSHAREIQHTVEVALTRDGRILGVRDKAVGDLGVGTGYPHGHTLVVSAFMLPGPYKVENYQFEAYGIVTNKCAFGAYRGFGGPESAFAMELMMNKMAKELSVDPAELRLRNLVTNADFPYTCVTGMVIENGTFTESIRKALEVIGYDDFVEQQEEARRNGRYLGIGMSCNVETTVPNICYSTGIITGHDFVKLSIGRDGKLTVFSGVTSIGTGVETSLAQVAADSTGIEFDDVTVVVGDTQSTPYSTGPWGSRVAAVCGAAIMDGGQKLRDKILNIAAHLLEARQEDLRIEGGEVFVAGSPKSKVSLREIAEVAISSIHKLPRGMDPGLEITTSFDPPLIRLTPDEKGRINVTGATNNSAHACIVEVDAETGKVKILRYVIVHDVGNMINPAIVEGQVVGGAMQSLGGTLYEELIYDRDGQLLTSTLMDYLLPSAVEAPKIELHHFVTPTPYIPGGFKGAGESGTVSVPACITNAVMNALEPFDVSITQTPLTPEKMWRVINGKIGRRDS